MMMTKGIQRVEMPAPEVASYTGRITRNYDLQAVLLCRRQIQEVDAWRCICFHSRKYAEYNCPYHTKFMHELSVVIIENVSLEPSNRKLMPSQRSTQMISRRCLDQEFIRSWPSSKLTGHWCGVDVQVSATFLIALLTEE